MTLRAPFPWFGGKRRVAHHVWDRLGNVRNYIEPFFGSGAVLLGRPGEPGIETVNDADAYLANFWRAISGDPDGVARYADWPVNEADLHARHRDTPNLLLSEVTDALPTQCCKPQAALIQRTPFLVQYYGTGTATSADEAVPTITGVDRHAVVTPGEEITVEDCYFRMLQPAELQRGMAFPDSYKVLGNNRDRVKQLGNAVTPPAMAWLIRQCVASLHPECM